MLFEVEHGTSGYTRYSTKFFVDHRDEFATFLEAWIWYEPYSKPLALGFYRPGEPLSECSSLVQAAIPNMVLIDELGDQLWFSSGVSCGYRGEGPSGAESILEDAGFIVTESPRGYFQEMHFMDRLLVSVVNRDDKPAKNRFLGKALLADGKLATLLEYQIGTKSEDVIRHWTSLTSEGSWFGPPAEITLYPTIVASDQAGSCGHHLIALDDSGQQVRMKFPEPFDKYAAEYDRMALYGWIEDAARAIFTTVGMDISQPLPTKRWWQTKNQDVPMRETIKWVKSP